MTEPGCRCANGCPRAGVTAVILALHGFGDYSNAFAMPAQVWAARGIATYAYDQRGFGGAPGRGLWAGEGQLAVDAITASRLLRLAYPGRPLYLLGESMGGAVAILAATGAIGGMVPGQGAMPVAEADGVILSAPAVWGRATMDLLPKLALFAGVRLFPDMILSGSGLRILASDNLPMLRALARDPLVLKGARLDTVYGLVDLMDDALAAAPRLTAPTLFLYGAHDQVIPRPPIAEFVAHLPSDPGHQAPRLLRPGLSPAAARSRSRGGRRRCGQLDPRSRRAAALARRRGRDIGALAATPRRRRLKGKPMPLAPAQREAVITSPRLRTRSSAG